MPFSFFLFLVPGDNPTNQKILQFSGGLPIPARYKAFVSDSATEMVSVGKGTVVT